MSSRGCVCLHPAPLLGYLQNHTKSNYSRTYKRVFLSPTIPALTQGVGEGALLSSSSWPTANSSWLRASATKSNVSPTSAFFANNPFVSPTYAKTGGWPPCGKCRRADISDFSPYFLQFSSQRRTLQSFFFAAFFSLLSFAPGSFAAGSLGVASFVSAPSALAAGAESPSLLFFPA